MSLYGKQKLIVMSFLKFNSKKLIYLISKYRKEIWKKDNECIFQLKTNSNVTSEI